MKLVISLLFHFFVSLLIILQTGEGNINYESLIRKVYDEYATFGIIMTTDHLSFEKMTALQIISREMSSRGIGSVVMEFKQLKEAIKCHHKQSARPLVIFIDKITDIQMFKESIVNMDMSYPVWLVLFTGDNYEDNCGYCRYPIGNPLNTEVLASCCNSSSLMKWSSNNSDKSNTLFDDEAIEKVNEIGGHRNKTLNSGRQFSINKEFRIAIPKHIKQLEKLTVDLDASFKKINYLLTDLTTFNQEFHESLMEIRNHYKTPHLKSSKSPGIWRSGNVLDGYLGGIIMELSEVMNFSISSQVVNAPIGDLHSNRSTLTDVIDAITQSRAEIGAAFTITSKQLATIDFSLPVLHMKYELFIAQSVQFSVQWNGFFKVFHPKIWIVVVILLLITSLLLIIIEYEKGCNLFDLISIHYLNVWGLFCSQSWSSPPERKPSRILFLSLFISTLVVNAGYSAALIRHLTTAPPYVQFRNFPEFVRDGTYEVIAIRGSTSDNWIQATNDPDTRTLKRMMKPSDAQPINHAMAIQQLCTQRVALVHFEFQEISQADKKCPTIALSLGGMFPMGFTLPLGSEYTGIVNHHIRRFQENGVLNRLKKKHSTKSDPPDTSYKSVTFKDVLPLLTFFAAGCSIALIIFSQETRRIDN